MFFVNVREATQVVPFMGPARASDDGRCVSVAAGAGRSLVKAVNILFKAL
jgi:hypothetical protein